MSIQDSRQKPLTAEQAPPIPFIDNGEGFPTPDSARQALTMFKLSPLADMSVVFNEQKGTMTDLITKCKIEHLVTNWPKQFIGMVVGIATDAKQKDAGR